MNKYLIFKHKNGIEITHIQEHLQEGTLCGLAIDSIMTQDGCEMKSQSNHGIIDCKDCLKVLKYYHSIKIN